MLEEAQASNKVFINLLSWETKLGSDFTSENKILFTASQSAHAGLKAYLCKKDKMRPHAHWSLQVHRGHLYDLWHPNQCVFCQLLLAKSWSQMCPDTRLLRNSHEAFFCLWCHFHFLNKSGTESKGADAISLFFLLKVSQCQRHMNQAHMTKHLFSNLWRFCCLRD